MREQTGGRGQLIESQFPNAILGDRLIYIFIYCTYTYRHCLKLSNADFSSYILMLINSNLNSSA